MKINIPLPQLQKALELTVRVSTKHITLPILQCVHLQTKQDRIIISATNLEIGIIIEIPCEVEIEGVIAIPAQVLVQTLQYLQSKTIHITLEDTMVVIESGTTITKLNTFPVDEFPLLTKESATGAILQKDLFSQGIKHVSFAASTASIKPELGSVFIQQKRERSLTFVATDSFRLMEKTIAQKDFIFPHAIMIPAKNAQELARVCDLLTTNPEMIVTENTCILQFLDEGVYITSRLVTGTFPDYEQIIPKEYSTHVKVVKNDFQMVLKKTQIFLNKFQQVHLKVVGSMMTISSQNGELGTTMDTISIQTEGEDIALNFNQNYLGEVLSHLHDDQLQLAFAGIGRPLVIKGANDTSVRYLVMPMNR